MLNNIIATFYEYSHALVAVRSFYTTAVDYARKNLPLTDSVLENAAFVNFEAREVSFFSQVEFFVNRYNSYILIP